VKNKHVENWVNEMAALCGPARVCWLTGSAEEKERLTQEALKTGELMEVNQEIMPGCVLHRTAVNDVARTEHLTFICTDKKEDAGPTNNWMGKKAAYDKLRPLFKDAMKGRTMYVVPFIMGPVGSPFSKIGVELTDSIYVVLNMRIMTRMGDVALGELGDSNDFTRCLHSKADLDITKRFICHFPEDNAIWSIGSGYGGNVLLGKKCLALRIASYLGYREGWMAEHMLILGLEDPQGNVTYIAAAFPSACGKTNLAMLVPPKALEGYKVWTVGDDIAWMRVGDDGRLWAINPESGFFGVVPNTSMKSNPNALKMIQKDTIFTNVLQKKDGSLWWEGMDGEVPSEGTDWKGDPWTPASGGNGAHPNSRFTAPASGCPCISPKWEDPHGVPISAIVFGGRRAKVAPLIYEAFNWQHGVYVGATMASETTSAATHAVGVVRRDPMAMLPFCGYNMDYYFDHWLKIGKKLTNPPKIFHVNWFRTDDTGKFIWPGFGENIRVLEWIVDRCSGKGKADTLPIGYVPTHDALDLRGLSLSDETLTMLLGIDKESWRTELAELKEFFKKFDGKLPKELIAEYEALSARLNECACKCKK
jgi:phosphoenolpyruvate carboxykinase (GTP)